MSSIHFFLKIVTSNQITYHKSSENPMLSIHQITWIFFCNFKNTKIKRNFRTLVLILTLNSHFDDNKLLYPNIVY
jgi:hypothetical protein